MTTFLYISITTIGILIFIKVFIWLRTILYSTLLMPSIIKEGESESFYIKIKGRVLFFRSYYISTPPCRWREDDDLHGDMIRSPLVTPHITMAYLFINRDPVNVINDYLKRYESKVYRRLNKESYKEISVAQWKQKQREELQESFINDEISHESFIANLNKLDR